MIVCSPPLVRSIYAGMLSTTLDGWFVCVDVLRRHVEVPEASTYFMEARDRQWPDGSGTQVRVRSDGTRIPRYGFGEKIVRGTLLTNVTPYLRKLGCKPGGPPVTIYFRLLYEV